ncbi:MAG: regulatory protein RecX [Porticoccaceae bacterium]|nr:regulatory protein RecX [Porticoccaceae bacterium]
MLQDPTEITPAKIRIAAMDLLTGREYSRAELATKLNKRFDSHDSIDQVLVQIAEEGLQSDKRFAEAFIRSRIYRGHGLSRIRQDIRQKGVADELVAVALEEADIDWYALAKDVAERKFGLGKSEDYGLEDKNDYSLEQSKARREKAQKEKARQMRFMQYRGFSYDQIKYALDSSADSDDFDN